MKTLFVILLALLVSPVYSADYQRQLTVSGKSRTYKLHVPTGIQTAPLVLAFHGIGMSGSSMETYSGLTPYSNKNHFAIAYPDGLRSGGQRKFNDRTDVDFARAMVVDAATLLTVDGRRIFACGMSNGGTMCYRLAAEASDLFSAVGVVSGCAQVMPNAGTRPVNIIHFHGTDDTYVPYNGSAFTESVPNSISTWLKKDACGPVSYTDLPSHDSTPVTKSAARSVAGFEVILYTINGGGHAWPNRPTPRRYGTVCYDLDANDLIWDFFNRHPKSN